MLSGVIFSFILVYPTSSLFADPVLVFRQIVSFFPRLGLHPLSALVYQLFSPVLLPEPRGCSSLPSEEVSLLLCPSALLS